ncbi:hypothetical protein Ahy_B02g059796 [Arachis hypogaea]|uniref:Protein FAR1-RELATED SEQUENCE n=1 Tax=Arachis hypogaea TaxID=3818 RepID=A0A445AHC8_ARAHY|nr:hypothetical protein Ahy_B02g059796 [Arachis hypogaea]
MRIDAKGHRDVHANKNLPVVHLAHHEEDPKQTKRLQATQEIEQEMSYVVWNSFTKDAFDRNWDDFVTKYGLRGKKWLSELYEDCHIWIPVYLDHHFWVRMRSTQRSESMHAFFNKFITRNSSLSQFVKQYDNCLVSREQRERIRCCRFSHCDTMRNKISKRSSILALYTHEKFRKVQAQFRGKENYIKRSKHFTLVSREVKCQCLLFKSKGILCCHSLNVLSFERVDNVVPKYILKRWSKNIKRRYTHIKSNQESLYWSREVRDSMIWYFDPIISVNLPQSPRK